MKYISNPIDILSTVIPHAAYVAIPEFQHEVLDFGSKAPKTAKRRHNMDEVVVMAMFPQTWGNGGMGFTGMATASPVTEYVTILSTKFRQFGYFVYFGHRLAYNVVKPNDLFWEHVSKNTMKDVDYHKEYETVTEKV